MSALIFGTCWKCSTAGRQQIRYWKIYKNINKVGNLITLNNSIHAMSNKETLTVTNLTLDQEHIQVHNNFSGKFLLLVNYLRGLLISELIQSTKVLLTVRYRVTYLYQGALLRLSQVNILKGSQVSHYPNTMLVGC